MSMTGVWEEHERLQHDVRRKGTGYSKYKIDQTFWRNLDDSIYFFPLIPCEMQVLTIFCIMNTLMGVIQVTC